MSSHSDIGGVKCEFDWGTVSPSVAIVESIEMLEHGEVTNTADVLEMPLKKYIDADALNTLVTSNSQLSLSLEVDDYQVEIEGDTVGVTSSNRTVDAKR